jgi:integrase
VWVAERGRWQVTTCANGVKRRRFFASKEEALREWKGHVRKVAQFGREAAEYDARAHREWAEAKRIVGADVDLRDVARFWVAHNAPVKSVPLAVAVEDYLLAFAARNVAAVSVGAVTSHLRALASSFGRVMVSEVSSNGVLSWLLGRGSARSIKNNRVTLSAFFDWAQRRGFLGESPMKGIAPTDLPRVLPSAKGILSVAQCWRLMEAVERLAPASAPWFALRLFAGLRRAEAGRMRWEWLDIERRVVNMPAFVDGERVVKTGDNWSLRGLPENLWVWLEKYRGEGKVSVPSEKVERMVLRSVGEWPRNALRHTFCTMLISLWHDAARVANWSRHSSPRQLYQSYVTQLVSEEEARAFCEIVPAGWGGAPFAHK